MLVKSLEAWKKEKNVHYKEVPKAIKLEGVG